MAALLAPLAGALAGSFSIAGLWQIAIAINAIGLAGFFVASRRAAALDRREGIGMSDEWATRTLRRTSLLMVGAMMFITVFLIAAAVEKATGPGRA